MIRVDYDAELQRHHQVLQRTWGIQSDDHVLDIGCGAGQTTRDAARLAWAGSALGVDVAAAMIERARRLTEAAGLPNASFERADAAVHPFPARSFDVAISRFGTMFFAHPGAAFANIARAVRPEGRLVMMVWREHEANEWSVLIERALGAGPHPPPGAPLQPGPFGLADPTLTEAMLDAAGFVKVSFTDVHVAVYYGPDVPAALEWILGFSSVTEALRRLDPVSAESALERLRQALAGHVGAQGVWLDSRAWLVAARRR